MKIGVIGCQGRMGKAVVKEIVTHKECILSGAVARFDHEVVGKDAGELIFQPKTGIEIHADMEMLFKDSEAVIEFTSPSTTLEAAELAVKYGVILVSGTTGLSKEDHRQLDRYAEKTPIIWASNMSLGMNVVIEAIRQIAGQLGSSYDVEISEIHHRHKKDGPSGSAYALAQAVSEGRGYVLDAVANFRAPTTHTTRASGEIGITYQRAGEIPGTHTVVFAGGGESIELKHTSSDRAIFAKGALNAALWAKDKVPGKYCMKDILGL